MSEEETIDDLLDQWEQARSKPSIDVLCQNHAHLQPRLEERIRLLNAVQGFIEPSVTSRPDLSAIPESIGSFRILEKIGEGGMGVVYKAEQRTPVQRIVAIKLIKLGMATREVIARFHSERQALARMDCPYIAKVMDAGSDEFGQPYFVMEYVPGVPITQFADTNRLSMRQRLELFLLVCEGVAHAHTKALIHRDIKASNVLAYVSDGENKVKIIDFGIVKSLTGERLSDQTFNTARGFAMGTYEAMSPEQAEGSPDIDSRTDVYSMGVLLYELLTGAKPFDRHTLSNASESEIRRILKEDNPPRPSTRLRMLGESASKIAASRQLKVEQLRLNLISELEWIPLKAMHKERDRRYRSIAYLADDVTAYLEGRPLSAAPDSWAYRIHKSYRRNRPVVGWAFANAGITLTFVWWPWFVRRNVSLNSIPGYVGQIPDMLIFAALLQFALRLTGLSPRILSQFVHIASSRVVSVLLSVLVLQGATLTQWDQYGLYSTVLAGLISAAMLLPFVRWIYGTTYGKAVVVTLMSDVLTTLLFIVFCPWSIHGIHV